MSAPARRLNALGLAVVVLAVIAGVLLHTYGLSAVVAVAVAVVILLVGVGALWLRFLANPVAPAYEALLHHSLIERAAWRRETGTVMPRSRAAAAAWLRRYPEPSDPTPADLLRRATLLMRTGALDQAGIALRRIRPETPSDRFVVLLEMATLDTLEGRRVDLQPIREAYLAIDEKAERRLRRICLGSLEAHIAMAEGADPWPPLLAARADIDRVVPAASLRAVTARVFALLIVLSGLTAVVLLSVGR
jgi:hypothetical protein